MKIERINDDDLDIYVNPYNFKLVACYDKDSLVKFIKDILTKIDIRYKINWCGFYKIKAYFNSKVGMFLNVIKIDDNDFNNEADYRIILFRNDKFLFETDDYDIIKDKKNIKFYNNLFYIDVDDIDDIIPFIDMGRIIYGDESKKILLQSKNLK